MAEFIETDSLVIVLGSATSLTDASLAILRAAVTGEAAAAELDGDFVVLQRLGPIVRAQLSGVSLALNIERRDGTRAVFTAPSPGPATTVVETEVLAASVVQAGNGAIVWPAASGTTLHFPTGRTIPVDRTMLIGRSPRVERVPSTELPALVPLGTDDPAVSRTHLRVSVSANGPILEDLASTNGTAIAPVGGVPRALRPGELAELVDGMVVTIAERVAFRVVLA